MKRWSVLFELPREFPSGVTWGSAVGTTRADWSLQARFMKDDGIEENGRTFWAVYVFHGHHSNPDATNWEHCGRTNRDELIEPKYECNKCGIRIPTDMVRLKIKRLQELHGTDPLNDRRGAVLATRKKHNL